jgi:hypothetical protein
MDDLVTKAKALAAALSAKLALVQAVLVAAGAVVPFLPLAWQAKALGVLVAAGGWYAAVVALVSRVTPVPPSAQGLVVPPGRELTVEVHAANGRPIEGITTPG